MYGSSKKNGKITKGLDYSAYLPLPEIYLELYHPKQRSSFQEVHKPAIPTDKTSTFLDFGPTPNLFPDSKTSKPDQV